MKISAIYSAKKPVVSLEVFPPKAGKGPEEIVETIARLQPLRPDYISVTYSAGGTGVSGMTTEIAALIRNRYHIESVAHLTCVRAGRGDIVTALQRLRAAGVENIMALRGDLPADFSPEESMQYRYAKDLIREIRAGGDPFCIGAAAYPEGHLSADSVEDSLVHLQEKVEAGADFLVTQLFFDNRAFYSFYEKARKMGISVPISAGIMPILGRSQIQKMIFMCGVSLPAQIIRILNRYEGDPESLVQAGIDYSSRQIRELIEFGVDGVHIYTMNRPKIAQETIANIQR